MHRLSSGSLGADSLKSVQRLSSSPRMAFPPASPYAAGAAGLLERSTSEEELELPPAPSPVVFQAFDPPAPRAAEGAAAVDL